MAAEGCQIVQHYREMAFMGFVAVLKNMGKVRRNFRLAKEALLRERPDTLVLIDYPSFNLKMAAFCRKALPDTRIIYYIPPKIWAWKSWRIHKICALSDEVLGIFPFEPDYYAERGYRCTYVGNPTVDSIRKVEAAKEVAVPQEKTANLTIALLPGSRRSEIANCLPTMLAAAQAQQSKAPATILIAGAPGIEPAFYKPFAGDVPVAFEQTYDILKQADVAIVNSGTATLEAALLKCPQVAVYHLAFPRLVALLRPPFERMVFRLPFFTLPNIILHREVICELVANDFTLANVQRELTRLLTDTAYRQQQQADYQQIADTLGQQSAPETAAKIILSTNCQ